MAVLGGMSWEIRGGVFSTFAPNTRRKGSRVVWGSGINFHYGKLGF